MTTTINNSYSAIVPAVYGTATPVIDVGRGAGSVDAVVALTRAGSVVVNLGSAPPGAVTYSVSGLAHEMSMSTVAAPEARQTVTAADQAAALAGAATAAAPMQEQDAADAGSGQTTITTAGMYDDRGAFTPATVIALDTLHMPGSAAGPSGVASGGNADSAGGAGAIGSLVSTQA